MKNGYRIFWTEHALNELEETYNYLEQRFSEKELKALSLKIKEVLTLISRNPRLFPIHKAKIRRVVILKYNTLYYRQKGGQIEVLSFFSNRKKP